MRWGVEPSLNTEEDDMLGTARLTAFVATAHPDGARQFYEGTLGLQLLTEDSFALAFDVSGMVLRVQKVAAVEAAAYTVLGWQVPDIQRAVTGLSRRGVSFERYSFMQQDALGVWTAPGGTKVAWFKDPDNNLLSLAEHGAPANAGA
jgi:catechol 2,3-dioxygenase-like lactoylglutathione lyase family enzyme